MARVLKSLPCADFRNMSAQTKHTENIMNKVQKFKSFGELKSSESKTIKQASSLKKHHSCPK